MKSIQFILIFLFFCVLHGTSLSANNEEIEKSIMLIKDKINQCVLQGDFEKLLSYFTDDMIIVPIFQPPIKGKNAYKLEIRKMKEKGIKYQSISGTTTDLWQCGDMIYETGTFGMSLTTKESRKPIAYYGSYFHIWQKQADTGYQIKYMISNLDFNPFER